MEIKNNPVEARLIKTRIDGFTLKPAVAEDIPLVYKFIQAIAEYEEMTDQINGDEATLYRSMIENDYAKGIIAYENDTPIGFMLYYYNFSSFECRPGIHLEDLFIYKEYRGKGYGRLMLSYLCELAAHGGFTRIEWTCLNWNKPSIKFYEGLGARNLCEWRTYRLTGDNIMKNADFFIGRESKD